jgi:hypothetical protein
MGKVFLRFLRGRLQENDDSVGWAWSTGLVRHEDAGDLDVARAWACWAVAGGARGAAAQSSGSRGLWPGSWAERRELAACGKQKREKKGGPR